MRTSIKSALIATVVAVTLTGCTNPYDPGQRALGGAAMVQSHFIMAGLPALRLR